MKRKDIWLAGIRYWYDLGNFLLTIFWVSKVFPTVRGICSISLFANMGINTLG